MTCTAGLYTTWPLLSAFWIICRCRYRRRTSRMLVVIIAKVLAALTTREENWLDYFGINWRPHLTQYGRHGEIKNQYDLLWLPNDVMFFNGRKLFNEFKGNNMLICIHQRRTTNKHCADQYRHNYVYLIEMHTYVFFLLFWLSKQSLLNKGDVITPVLVAFYAVSKAIMNTMKSIVIIALQRVQELKYNEIKELKHKKNTRVEDLRNTRVKP